MGWRTVIVSQHAKISYSGRRIIVQTSGDVHQIPIDDVQILLIATTQAVLTTAAITELSDVGAKIIFTNRQGNPSCEVTANYPGNRSVLLIEQQVNWSQQLKDTAWTAIVKAKIEMQIQCARYLDKSTIALEKELKKLEFADITNREAVIARQYFQLIYGEKFIRNDANPINAALNYGYSILLSAINREIVANGYLTQFGIHHHNNASDFNLGSDLMEPFRPFIDGWVANQKFSELTADVKFGIVSILDLEIVYNNQKMILRNALTKHVQNCLNYMANPEKDLIAEVVMTNEVSHYVLNNNV